MVFVLAALSGIWIVASAVTIYDRYDKNHDPSIF